MPHPVTQHSLDTVEQRALLTVYADEIINPSTSLEITKVMVTLVMVNRSLRAAFQAIVNTRVSKHSHELMHLVLQGEPEKARAIYSQAPNLLFMPVIATDLGAGLNADYKPVYRIIHSTPLRAMVGGSDVWMLEDVLKTLPKYHDAVFKQLETQFPNGFECEKATFDYTRLVNAITSDQELIDTRIPNQITKAALLEFRQAFLPDQDSTKQTLGHHFNMNEYEHAHQVYFANETGWDGNQCSLFQKRVLGLLQGLFSVSDGQALVQNPEDVSMPGGEGKLIRRLKVRSPNRSSTLQSLFDHNADYLLGRDFNITRPDYTPSTPEHHKHSSSFTLFNQKVAYLKSMHANFERKTTLQGKELNLNP